MAPCASPLQSHSFWLGMQICKESPHCKEVGFFFCSTAATDRVHITSWWVSELGVGDGLIRNTGIVQGLERQKAGIL